MCMIISVLFLKWAVRNTDSVCFSQNSGDLLMLLMTFFHSIRIFKLSAFIFDSMEVDGLARPPQCVKKWKSFALISSQVL